MIDSLTGPLQRWMLIQATKLIFLGNRKLHHRQYKDYNKIYFNMILKPKLDASLRSGLFLSGYAFLFLMHATFPVPLNLLYQVMAIILGEEYRPATTRCVYAFVIFFPLSDPNILLSISHADGPETCTILSVCLRRI
jgi:hypothetical protein